MEKRTARGMLIAGMTFGVVMLCGPFFGAIAALMRLNHGLAKTGISDARGAAEGVGAALTPLSIGLFLCPMGLMVLIVCIVLWRRAARPEPTKADSAVPTVE